MENILHIQLRNFEINSLLHDGLLSDVNWFIEDDMESK